MNRREKIGVVLIVAVLVLLGLVYALTFARTGSASGDFVNNPITERRVNNLRGR